MGRGKGRRAKAELWRFQWKALRTGRGWGGGAADRDCLKRASAPVDPFT